MYYYVFRRDTRYGYYDYIQDFDTMTITEDPARAAQVNRIELAFIDLDYIVSLGFHPVEITALGIRHLATLLFRPRVRHYRPRIAPPPPRRVAPPPPPRPRPRRVPAGRAAVRPVAGVGRAPRPLAPGGRAAVPPARPPRARHGAPAKPKTPARPGVPARPAAPKGPHGGRPRGRGGRF